MNTSICDIGAAMYADQAVLLALAAREKPAAGSKSKHLCSIHKLRGFFIAPLATLPLALRQLKRWARPRRMWCLIKHNQPQIAT